MKRPAIDLPPLTWLVAPLVLALLAGSWLLWTRAEPSRQGGYCMNATVDIAGVLERADSSGDVGRGPLPSPKEIFASLGAIDMSRLQVDTPAAVRDDVNLLAHRLPELRASHRLADADSSAAFTRIAADYLRRCRAPSS